MRAVVGTQHSDVEGHTAPCGGSGDGCVLWVLGQQLGSVAVETADVKLGREAAAGRGADDLLSFLPSSPASPGRTV